MLDAIDDALAAWLATVLEQEEVTFCFERPGEEPHADAPVIASFLYDVVEEIDGRGGHLDDVRDDLGRVVARQGTPRRFALHYSLSVVGADARTQHRLLGRVLRAAIDHERLPDATLPPAIKNSGLGIDLRVGQARPDGRTGSGALWLAIGDRVRTTLDLVLVVAVQPTPVTELERPAERIDLGVGRRPATGSRRPRTPGDKRWTTFRVREPGPEA